jgi:zona occludens toxin (predicted ATPase)
MCPTIEKWFLNKKLGTDMKTKWIKLFVALALVFLVVFWGIIFWPAGTEPEDTTGDLKTPPQVQQTRVESLYRTAVFHKERDNPSDMDFRITADCCRKILTDYPNTPHAQRQESFRMALAHAVGIFLYKPYSLNS